MKTTLVGLFCCLLCTACTSPYATNAEKEYLKSRNGVPLSVPKPLSDFQITHGYDLPTPKNEPAISISPPTEGTR
ncbi:MAG: hypothetical protein Q8R79_03575 [Legionellaceae bacterium]|nr:hypothetical protein [Legionellaceae bacterium]